MKKIIALLVVFIVAHSLKAQEKVLLLDREKLFTTDERKQMDSLLQQYYKATGNYVGIVTTDTLDINPGDYSARFAEQQRLSALQNNYGLILLLSRKQELIYLTGTGQLSQVLRGNELAPQAQEALAGIISTGIPDLQEKRTAEGVMKICKRAMKFIEELAKIMQEPAPKH
ncbi:MAG: TPM domain-containing protein [Cyclobacteriaceae bacterium]|nr:TPM domain-containing protein [Cyclobacteriaceae bacterium]